MKKDNTMTTPYFFLSSGDKTAMFTLRFCPDPSSYESKFICNLSTDSQKAIDKALTEIAYSEYPLDTSYADTTLAEIIRRNQEQIEADNERRKQENLTAWVERSLDLIAEGKNPFKAIYDSSSFDGAYGSRPVGYQPLPTLQREINYWATLTECKSPVHEAMHNLYKDQFVALPENLNKHFSTVGEKVTVRAMVLDFDMYENPYTYNGYILKVRYITENGERLITKGNADTKFNESIENVGVEQWVELDATVKSHNEFTDEEDKVWKTTSLIRPKLNKVC